MLKAKIWRWLDEVVIGEQFCPFAKRPREQNKIQLQICEATTHEAVLGFVADQFSCLSENPNIDTTLIALPNAYADFYDYLDLLEAAQQLLQDLGFDGVYQLASFHPDYLFEAEPAANASHFTNRSPCPIIHILREKDVTKALASTASPEAIPIRNIAHAETLGAEFFKKYLK